MKITVLLLGIYVISSALPANLYKAIASRAKTTAASATLPFVWFSLIALFFTVLALFSGESFELAAFPIAALSGICIFTAVFLLIESMKVASLSLSVVIVNLNFIIPVVLSALFLGESVGILQLLGMMLSVAVIVVTNLSGNGAYPNRLRALVLPLVACLSNGLVNYCIKLNEHLKFDSLPFFSMMYWVAAFSALLFGVAISRKKSGSFRPLSGISLKPILPMMLLLGLCNGVCFYMAGLLASRMNAAAQFTIVTCASILLSVAIGVLFQGDRLDKKSAISMLACTAAILCQYAGFA